MRIIKALLLITLANLVLSRISLAQELDGSGIEVVKYNLLPITMDIGHGYPNIITRYLQSTLRLRNVGAKTIYVVNWDYVLIDPKTEKEVVRYRFQKLKKILPHESDSLIGFFDTIHTIGYQTSEIWKISNNYKPNHYREQVVITYVGYVDLSTWHPRENDSAADGSKRSMDPMEDKKLTKPPVLKETDSRKSISQGEIISRPQQSPEEMDEGTTVRINTRLVSIPIIATDATGRYITDLKEQEFHIYEDGIEQQIASFSLVEQPVNVILLLDVSGSTDWTLDKLKSEAIAFVEQLRPNDYVFVVSFDNVPHALHNQATNDQIVLREAILSAQTSGRTSLYDAVHSVIERILKPVRGRKALVIFTDGLENSSLVGTKKGTLRDSEELDALIYTVQYSSDLIFMENKYLKRLAENTGGRFYKGNNEKKVRQAFALLAEELRRQYTVSYYPRAPAVSGQSHDVKVTVDRPGVRLKARKTYVIK